MPAGLTQRLKLREGRWFVRSERVNRQKELNPGPPATHRAGGRKRATRERAASWRSKAGPSPAWSSFPSVASEHLLCAGALLSVREEREALPSDHW